MTDTMEPNRILITGQFWDSEFADLINGIESPTTLLTSERIERAKSWDEKFDLVLVAQSGRDSISQALIDHLHKLLGKETPVINLLGSWCEGQERSGKPLQNVLPIYWHQWSGGIKQLLAMARAGTAYPQSDLISAARMCVGVSTLSHPQASYLDDALEFLGAESVWLEQQEWQAEQTTQDLQAICVDGDSMTANFFQRLTAIRGDYPTTPLIALLNFPRKEEVLELTGQQSVVAVVSKPFDLTRLARALGQATGAQLIAAEPLSGNSRAAQLQPVDAKVDGVDSDVDEFDS